MSSYTLRLTPDEHFTILYALARTDQREAFRKVFELQPDRTGGGTAAAHAVLSPPAPAAPAAPKILWSEDPRAPNMSSCERLLVTPMKVEEAGERLKVLWRDPGRWPHKYGAVWASNLFDAVKARVALSTTFYVQKSKDGKFTNIVGLEV